MIELKRGGELRAFFGSVAVRHGQERQRVMHEWPRRQAAGDGCVYGSHHVNNPSGSE